jgi:hypothetical protein
LNLALENTLVDLALDSRLDHTTAVNKEGLRSSCDAQIEPQTTRWIEDLHSVRITELL